MIVKSSEKRIIIYYNLTQVGETDLWLGELGGLEASES